ncbi:MAG: hypothetical protein KAW00_02875 [Dehalococcoidia bacterium]|nr:hypothetical protein [Dehalococcoidia bacterium]
MAAAETWKDRWKRINSKFDTCKSECITHYRSDDKCRDSIEAVIADIWNLKDWLAYDPTANVDKTEIDAFLKTGESLHISVCGDIETKRKHYRVTDLHRENTELIREGNYAHPSGPLIYSVTRTYKDASGTDHYEDACELARRAIEQWKKFLTKRGLL